MSNGPKYNNKTLMELLKVILSSHDEISVEEKQEIINTMQMLLKQSGNIHEDKQSFPITNYKRRN